MKGRSKAGTSSGTGKIGKPGWYRGVKLQTPPFPPRTPIEEIRRAVTEAVRKNADAIVKAKLDAQNYADSLGYATATVVSVSERGDVGTIFSFATSIAARGPKNMFEPSRGDTVPIDVAVTVTFRLDGKK